MARGKRVMVVDSQSMLRSTMAAHFKEMGYTVVAESESGQDAAKRFAELKPDLVTMNLGMVGGIPALKGLLDAAPDANVIVISGLHQKSLLMDALDVGAKDFLIEPFDKVELEEVASRN